MKQLEQEHSMHHEQDPMKMEELIELTRGFPCPECEAPMNSKVFTANTFVYTMADPMSLIPGRGKMKVIMPPGQEVTITGLFLKCPDPDCGEVLNIFNTETGSQ